MMLLNITELSVTFTEYKHPSVPGTLLREVVRKHYGVKKQ